jgi:exonuclease SbcD
VLLVDLDAAGLKAVMVLPVPRFQGLVAVSGNLLGLPAAIGTAAAQGTRECPAWLEVTVLEDDYLADLPERIQSIAEGLPVEVLRIRRQRGNATARLAAEASERLDELSPHEVFARRLAQEELADDLQQALNERFRGIVTALQEEAK